MHSYICQGVCTFLQIGLRMEEAMQFQVVRQYNRSDNAENITDPITLAWDAMQVNVSCICFVNVIRPGRWTSITHTLHYLHSLRHFC